MFTLCPNCDSVHRVDAGKLSAARGKLRCARCDTTFQALDALYDDYPDRRRDNDSPSAPEAPPEVGRKPQPNFPAADAPPPARSGRSLGGVWIIALVVLALVTTFNLAWTFRDSIPRESALGATLEEFGVPGFESPPPFRDPSLIHLLTRDIHAHPTQPGFLVLSATFINLADRAQPYPDLSVALKDPEDRVIAGRRFAPADYLAQAPGEQTQLAPGQQVPVLLEFADPGGRATGFELLFH